MEQTKVIVTKKGNNLYDIWFPQQSIDSKEYKHTEEELNAKLNQYRSWGYLVEVR